jgi:hypothetical protein
MHLWKAMKPNHYKILSISLKWVSIVALGYVLLIITYHISQGPDRCLNLGDYYAIGHFPGHLYYWLPGKPRNLIGLVDEPVEGLLVKDNWIVGKTRSYWFAIDKKSHRIYYPLSSEKEVIGTSREYWPAIDKEILHTYYPLGSEEEVKKIVGFKFSPSEMMTKYPEQSFWWSFLYEYKFETVQLVYYVGAGYAIIVFLVTIVRHVHRHRSRQ